MAQFAELIRRVEAGEEVELTRYGRPVARLISVPAKANRLVGCMKGQFTLPEGLDQPDDQIAAMFDESRLLPE